MVIILVNLLHHFVHIGGLDLLQSEDLQPFFAQSENEQIRQLQSHFADLETFKANRMPTMTSNGVNSSRVLYLKTHKTGSSSVSGILWRELCIKRQMNCFLPVPIAAGRTWELDDPAERQYAHDSVGTNLTRLPFDVWMNHVRPSEKLTRLLNAPYLLVSSVRRPAHRFGSAWHYFSLGVHRNVTAARFMSMLTNKPAHINSTEFKESWYKYGVGLEATSQELVGRSLGTAAFNQAFFHDILPSIFNYKLFLIVCDRFDESILILRWLLGWPGDQAEHDAHRAAVSRSKQQLRTVKRSVRAANTAANLTNWNGILGSNRSHFKDENIWYVPQKVRGAVGSVKTKRSTRSGGFSANDWSLLDAFQPHDLILYRAASVALDKLIGFYGPERFAKDLARYQRNLRAVHEHCAQYDIHTTCDKFSLPKLRAMKISPALLERMKADDGPVFDEECISFAIANANKESENYYMANSYTTAAELPDDVYACWNLRLDNVQYVKLFWKQLIDGATSRDLLFVQRMVDLNLVMSLYKRLSKSASKHLQLQVLSAEHQKFLNGDGLEVPRIRTAKPQPLLLRRVHHEKAMGV